MLKTINHFVLKFTFSQSLLCWILQHFQNFSFVWVSWVLVVAVRPPLGSLCLNDKWQFCVVSVSSYKTVGFKLFKSLDDLPLYLSFFNLHAHSSPPFLYFLIRFWILPLLRQKKHIKCMLWLHSQLCVSNIFSSSGTDFELFDLRINKKICKNEFTSARFLFGQTLPEACPITICTVMCTLCGCKCMLT